MANTGRLDAARRLLYDFWLPLTFSAADDYQHDPPNDQKSAEYRRERDALSLRMFKLERTKLRVFFFCRPVYPTEGEADDASDD